MNRKHFLKALSSELYPSLRDVGFRGSGATLRLVDDPVIQIFNVQGSTSADGCYINLGIHLQHVLRPNGDPPDPKTITAVGCLVYQRFRPIKSFREYRPIADRGSNPETWKYGSTAEECEASVAALVADWNDRGMAFFDRLRHYPEDFRAVVTDLDYAKHAERLDNYDLEYLNPRALRWLAEHFDLTELQATIDAEIGDSSAAARAALARKLGL